VFDKDNSVIKVYGSRFVDTGGGFLLEEKVGEPDDQEQVHILQYLNPVYPN
jgi:hypothetical protein